MKIVVVTSDGFTVVRPDTTWERKNSDFYVPELAGRLSWAPVAFAMISRPGKCIKEKFASRYYGDTGFGVLLYPDGLDSPQGYAQACCLNLSSCLPYPFPEDSVPDCAAGKTFSFFIDSKEAFTVPEALDCAKERIARAVTVSSQRVLFRNGDIIVAELAKPALFATSGGIGITGGYDEMANLIDFKIIV